MSYYLHHGFCPLLHVSAQVSTTTEHINQIKKILKVRFCGCDASHWNLVKFVETDTFKDSSLNWIFFWPLSGCQLQQQQEGLSTFAWIFWKWFAKAMKLQMLLNALQCVASSAIWKYSSVYLLFAKINSISASGKGNLDMLFLLYIVSKQFSFLRPTWGFLFWHCGLLPLSARKTISSVGFPILL